LSGYLLAHYISTITVEGKIKGKKAKGKPKIMLKDYGEVK